MNQLEKEIPKALYQLDSKIELEKLSVAAIFIDIDKKS